MLSFELIILILFTKHDAIYIANPSSMQDACNMNFVIDLAHRRDSVAWWWSIEVRNLRVWGSIPHEDSELSFPTLMTRRKTYFYKKIIFLKGENKLKTW